MSDEFLRTLWASHPSDSRKPLAAVIDAVLREDHAAHEKDRWARVAAVIALALLCPAALWCAVYGKTPLVRGGYALIGAGTAVMVFAEWMYLTWSRQALPGPSDARSQLQTTALLLSRQASLFKVGVLWCAPIFVGVALIALWIYRERSHAGGIALWFITGIGWLMAAVGSVAKGRQIAERSARMEQLLGDMKNEE